ncbi:MAG: hypothetical protein JJE35_11895 [Thermoleophilia bacterium]|nr:hypothetical protein [Thermoleophilia bacterium]
MAEEQHPHAILARAARYPYEAPLHSFVQTGGRTVELPRLSEPDLDGRTAVLAYGANASPEVLARKLAALPDVPLPLIYAELVNFDVVYSAHISPYGAVPSTLQRSPGTYAPVHVSYPTEEQLGVLSATEPNYELRELTGHDLHSEVGTEEPARLHAFVSRHGCLAIDDAEVALAAVEANPRRFPSMGELEVLEQVRHLLAPELDLERFVESSLDPGLARSRTAVLRGNALPLAE